MPKKTIGDRPELKPVNIGAAAIDIGETPTEPRVNEGMLSAELSVPNGVLSLLSRDVPSTRVTPMSAAVCTTLHRPTRFSSSA